MTNRHTFKDLDKRSALTEELDNDDNDNEDAPTRLGKDKIEELGEEGEGDDKVTLSITTHFNFRRF